jgi:hypothetical protein
VTGAQRAFQIHATAWFSVNFMLFLIWLITTPGAMPWFLIPAAAWGVGLATHATATFTAPVREDDEIDTGETPKQLGH